MLQNEQDQLNKTAESFAGALEEAGSESVFVSSDYKNVVASFKHLTEKQREFSSKKEELSPEDVLRMKNVLDDTIEKCKTFLKHKGDLKELIKDSSKAGKRNRAVAMALEYCTDQKKKMTALTSDLIRSDFKKQMERERDRLLYDSFTKDNVGKFIKDTNRQAFSKNPEMVRAAGKKLETAAKFINDNRLSPNDCGLTRDDLLRASLNITRGKDTAKPREKHTKVQQSSAPLI